MHHIRHRRQNNALNVYTKRHGYRKVIVFIQSTSRKEPYRGSCGHKEFFFRYVGHTTVLRDSSALKQDKIEFLLHQSTQPLRDKILKSRA